MKIKVVIEGDYLPQKGSHYQESVVHRLKTDARYFAQVLKSAFYELKDQKITITKGE